MSTHTLGLSENVQTYLLRHGVREPDIMRRLREETDALPMAQMRSSAEQVNALSLLIRLMDAQRIIEVGVFTGYATLGFARALPKSGKVFALDVSREWTDIGQRYWDEAGVADQIDLMIAPAASTLERLLMAGEKESVDFSFIDADKENYLAYYEACLELTRPGGLIAIDNVLWSGRVADTENQDADTRAIRALNEALQDDDRIDLAMLPIGDGLSLARKR